MRKNIADRLAGLWGKNIPMPLRKGFYWVVCKGELLKVAQKSKIPPEAGAPAFSRDTE